MAWGASATTSSGSASPWPCGTARTRSSRSACSASPTARATTVRTSRSTTSISTARPTHSYLKFLYKYPQSAFPYTGLARTSQARGRDEWEYELLDTGVFNEDRYFDVLVEYGKAGPEDLLVRVTAFNRGPEAAALHLLPTLWFRNTWTWNPGKPSAGHRGGRGGRGLALDPARGARRIRGPVRGSTRRCCSRRTRRNQQRLFGSPNASPYVKDAFHEYVIGGQRDAVNPARRGTKAAAHYWRLVGRGEAAVLRLRLTRGTTRRPCPSCRRPASTRSWPIARPTPTPITTPSRRPRSAPISGW